VVEAAGETTWERILRVSADLFAQKGYHGTGLSELTDAIRLGRGGLYHHIRSKDSLLAQISRKPIRDAAEQAEAIVAQNITAEEKVFALARGLISSIEAQPSPWIVFFREYSSLPPEHQREVLTQRERYLRSWELAVEQGVQSGDFCDDPPLFLEGLLAFFIYSYIWVNNKGVQEPLGESLARFVLRGLRKSL
jgi:Transcriptional regulator